MNINILDCNYDYVINSIYVTASVTYIDAVNSLVPLIDKLDFQRNPLRKSFYERLEKDIMLGCIMPNITIAIKTDDEVTPNQTIDENFINSHISSAFILDGIQRLNTMKGLASYLEFPRERKLYCNILICNSMDRLLYRMITLNNGQKPMSTRHQIEILAKNLFDFDKLAILTVTEKDKNNKGNKEAMNKDVLIKGYLAYMTGSTNIDNQKIIEDRMNELIAEKIMDTNINEKQGEFTEVVNYINNQMIDDYLNSWFKIPNNFIGFCAAMNTSFNTISVLNTDTLKINILAFEHAFSNLDVSKIKLGKARRQLVNVYFTKYHKTSNFDEYELLDYISQEL